MEVDGGQKAIELGREGDGEGDGGGRTFFRDDGGIIMFYLLTRIHPAILSDSLYLTGTQIPKYPSRRLLARRACF